MESWFVLLSWLLVYCLCFFKPVIQARGYKAFASWDTSLYVTSFSDSEGAREAGYQLEKNSTLNQTHGAGGRVPELPPPNGVTFTSLCLNFFTYKMCLLHRSVMKIQ